MILQIMEHYEWKRLEMDLEQTFEVNVLDGTLDQTVDRSQ